MRPFLLALLIALATSAPLFAQPPQLVAPTGPLTPAEERKKFTVPEGFEVQLVAAEPDIQKPMQMAFDAKGRIWLNTSHHYPFAAERGKSTDKLYVLSDFGPDGKAGKIEVFADFLNIPIGILPLPDCKSCIVSSLGEILKLTDTDGDGKSDKREVLFTGFGTRDTHGMYNSFTPMPDGWIYACHGFANDSTVKGSDGHEVKMHSGHTFRFKPDGSRIEVYTRGQVNPFGMTVDPWFNLYTADCHSRPITHLVPGSYYQSFGKPHDGLGFGQHVTRHDHGSTGLCGIAWYDADHFPKEFKGCMFVGNVVTSRINFDRIEWKGSTPLAKELPDFLTSTDPWFRPVDIKLGPDGALYVTDFYNKIIGHYEVDLKHPGRDKDRGRVWRIVWKGKDGKAPAPRSAFEDLTKEKPAGLVKLLEHSNISVRLAAANQLAEHGKAGVAAFPGGDYPKRDWVWQHPRVYATYLMLAERAGTADEDTHVNFAALPILTGGIPLREELTAGIARGLETRSDWGKYARQIAPFMLKDEQDLKPQPLTLRAFVQAIAAHPHQDFVKPLVELIPKIPDEDVALRHTARIALRNCLRDGNGWGPAHAVAADAKNLRVLLPVVLGVRSKEGAEFLAAQLDSHEYKLERHTRAGIPLQNYLEALEFIGKYGTFAEQNKIIVSDFVGKRDPELTALRFQVSVALLRGVREAREKTTWNIVDDTRYMLERGLARNAPPVHAHHAVQLLGLLLDTTDKRTNYDFIKRHHSQGLAWWMKRSDAPVELRTHALGIAVKHYLDDLTDAIGDVLADEAAPAALREQVVLILAADQKSLEYKAVREGIRYAMKPAPYRFQSAVAQAISGSRRGAELLLEAVDNNEASARLLQDKQILEKLRAAKVADLDKRIAELTRGLPPADLKLAALVKQRTTRFTSAKPDKAIGQKVYAKHCAACHKIGDDGGKVGPQLDGVGIRGLERLLEDTLDPNRNVDAAFRARVLNLTDGTTKTGLMLRVEGEVVVFADDEGKEFRVPTKDIESNRETALSPMPANVAEIIPEADFFHLMAYLLDQKAKEPPKN